jgi:hypothetical protein
VNNINAQFEQTWILNRNSFGRISLTDLLEKRIFNGYTIVERRNLANFYTNSVYVYDSLGRIINVTKYYPNYHGYTHYYFYKDSSYIKIISIELNDLAEIKNHHFQPCINESAIDTISGSTHCHYEFTDIDGTIFLIEADQKLSKYPLKGIKRQTIVKDDDSKVETYYDYDGSLDRKIKTVILNDSVTVKFISSNDFRDPMNLIENKIVILKVKSLDGCYLRKIIKTAKKEHLIGPNDSVSILYYSNKSNFSVFGNQELMKIRCKNRKIY